MMATTPTHSDHELRRSRRLAAQHQRPEASDEGQGPLGKRICTIQAGLARAGSEESCVTQFGTGGGLASGGMHTIPPALTAAAGSAVPGSAAPIADMDHVDFCSPASCGSDESQQTPLTGASLHRVGGGTPAAARAGGAASSPHPDGQHASQMNQQGQQQQQDASQRFLSPTFLAGLAEANTRVQRLPLPGGLPFYPVHPSCAMLPLFCVYGISPAAIVLGASYFQRVLAARDHLGAAADVAGFFSTGHPQAELVMHVRPCSDDALIAAYCTCVYLGIKVTDGVSFSNQLTHMLSAALGKKVDHNNAAGLEMQVLQLLGWRLGPYCCRPRAMGPW